MDYGKYKYRQKKKHHTKHHEVKVKEIRLRPNTDQHDFDVKVKRAREFLEKRDKVVVTLKFKGRELNFVQEGTGILNRFTEALEDVAKVEYQSPLERKRMSLTLTPRH
jgi:translation initiation factor IF-3